MTSPKATGLTVADESDTMQPEASALRSFRALMDKYDHAVAMADWLRAAIIARDIADLSPADFEETWGPIAVSNLKLVTTRGEA